MVIIGGNPKKIVKEGIEINSTYKVINFVIDKGYYFQQLTRVYVVKDGRESLKIRINIVLKIKEITKYMSKFFVQYRFRIKD